MHTPDESPEEASVEALPTGSEKPQKSRGPIKPFQPDLSVVKTRSQRIEYMSRWFIAAGTQILGHKPSWDYLCKNMADYIVSERMPDDPLVAGKPLEIAKPSFMPDVRFDALWRFLLDSYNGNLPSRKRFMFKVEALHQNMPVPQPPGDETVHQAAMNSAKTAPLKKAAAKGAPRKGRTRKSLPLPSSEDELFDAPGIAEDEDAALLSAALADPAGHRRKRMTRSVLRVESPEASDFEADAPQGSAPRGFRLPRGVAQSGATSSNEPFTEASRQGLPPAAVEQTANSKSAEKRETDSSRKEKPPLPPTSSTPNVRIPPRPRGTLSPATEVLRHPSSPANSEDLLNRWNERLQDLMTWGRRMGVGWPRGKVLRYKGFVKKEWAALLPTGLDSVFCLLQLGAASQTLGSAAAQLSIAPSAGLENLRPNHPAAKAVNDVLNSQISLPSVKILNIQFGASPGASDGFFDFVEGTLIAFLGRALQSEDVFMDGNVDVMQLLRVAMFVVGTGFIRDFSGLSAHTTRTNALGDRVNVFLASMALVRYHHIVLGGAIGGFCRDESITGMEKDMWLLLMQTWSLAVRTMARAIVQHRSDVSNFYRVVDMHELMRRFGSPQLFDQKCLSTTLPDALDRMLQASLAIRPWWSWSEEGLPPPVTFTTKRSVASSCLYDTLGVLHWSSLTLLERSQYLLLVFLAAIQIHSGRVPKTWPLMGVPPAISSSANSKPLEGMMTYLIGLKALIAVTDEDEQMNDGASIAAEADPTPAIDASPSTPVTPICNIPSPALPSPSGKDSQGKTENSLVGDSTVGSPSSGSMPQLDRQAISGPGSPRAQQNTSDSSSESVLSCEPEDSIWPEGEGRPEQMRVERVDGEQGRSPPVIQATSPSGDRPTSPPGNDITSAPGVVDPVIPAIRPRSPSPTITPKQKRRRLIPEAPSNWRTEEPPLEGRQLRSTRPAPPPRAAAPAAVATGSSSGSLRKLATITETQQAGLRASQRRGQPSRPKRPAS
ncbi:hypothetical protein FRC00_002730 [Tulasnella sp. 408]|nr:hypothetical protein FRC00_002730 [Tulasnella sp. 408]